MGKKAFQHLSCAVSSTLWKQLRKSAERGKNIFNISTFYGGRQKMHFQTSYCENHISHKQPEATNLKAKTVSLTTALCSLRLHTRPKTKVKYFALRYKCLNMWHSALQSIKSERLTCIYEEQQRSSGGQWGERRKRKKEIIRKRPSKVAVKGQLYTVWHCVLQMF